MSRDRTKDLINLHLSTILSSSNVINPYNDSLNSYINMRPFLFRITVAISVLLLLLTMACGRRKEGERVRAVYYWNTAFRIDSLKGISLTVIRSERFM